LSTPANNIGEPLTSFTAIRTVLAAAAASIATSSHAVDDAAVAVADADADDDNDDDDDDDGIRCC